MSDDEMMDGKLRAAMSGPPPEMSPTFVQDIQRRTAPRRLKSAGLILIGAYALAAVGLCVWAMRDVPVAITVAAVIVEAVVAVALRSYTARLADGLRPAWQD